MLSTFREIFLCAIGVFSGDASIQNKSRTASILSAGKNCSPLPRRRRPGSSLNTGKKAYCTLAFPNSPHDKIYPSCFNWQKAAGILISRPHNSPGPICKAINGLPWKPPRS